MSKSMEKILQSGLKTIGYLDQWKGVSLQMVKQACIA